MNDTTKKMLDGVETILFCDESKFYKQNGDYEDAIFYFCIAVKKSMVFQIHHQLKNILQKYKVQAPTFHAKTIFKETRPREKLMNEICNLIVINNLHCICFKYAKTLLFEPTKHLSYLNDGEIFKFEKQEFQALFYFLIILNTHLRDDKPNLLSRDIAMYFDRNVYGTTDIEAFNFPHEFFVIKQMTFVEKSKISLLALPDFFGYIFRKLKISQNKAQFGDNSLETSKLVITSYLSLRKITNAGLFHFLDIDNWILALEKVLGIEYKI